MHGQCNALQQRYDCAAPLTTPPLQLLVLQLLQLLFLVSWLVLFPRSGLLTCCGVARAETVVCLPPPCNATGDTDLQLLNPDGGRRLLPLALFYTNDCPFEGWWGRGTGTFPLLFL